jgi:hypothetical protein
MPLSSTLMFASLAAVSGFAPAHPTAWQMRSTRAWS